MGRWYGACVLMSGVDRRWWEEGRYSVVAATNEMFAIFLIGSWPMDCAITYGADTDLRRYWLLA